MSDELRQAAERVITGGFYSLRDHQEGGRAAKDRWMVAKAWLDEHPADDTEPVTEEWLLANGWRVDDDGRRVGLDQDEYLFVDAGEDRRLWMTEIGGAIGLMRLDRMTFEWEELCSFAPIPTRGHWRRMAALFGKESNQ